MSSARFVVLQKMRAERHIIFGELGQLSGITKAMKVEKWEEIAALAHSVGLLKSDKPWQYMRDTIWPNWRKRAMSKSCRNGATSEIDELILELMERPELPGDSGIDSVTQHNVDNIDSIECLLADSTANDTVYASPLQRKKSSHYVQEDMESRKRVRSDLQIENLRIKRYKMKLEALELEMRLGLPRSEFTSDLPTPSRSSKENDAYKDDS